jgi:hypothetical protein
MTFSSQIFPLLPPHCPDYDCHNFISKNKFYDEFLSQNMEKLNMEKNKDTKVASNVLGSNGQLYDVTS